LHVVLTYCLTDVAGMFFTYNQTKTFTSLRSTDPTISLINTHIYQLLYELGTPKLLA